MLESSNINYKNNFCASPWFHMRITNSGNMVYCRWSDPNQVGVDMQQVSPIRFFQTHMADIRKDLLNGSAPAGCGECYQMEQHGKVSGRQRQLLKIGVQLDQFEKTLITSPWAQVLANGEQNLTPQDWQIDLGNYCNSACVFCVPEFSSRLASEQLKLNIISQPPADNWSDNPAQVKQVIDALQACTHIQYIHFIGGETLIVPAFKQILSALIDAGLHRNATLGLTTNLTVWPQDVIDLLIKFRNINLGVSVETFTPVNNYVRWPAKLDTIKENLERWHQLALKHRWLMQIRTTPTALTIGDLTTVYDYAWQKNIAIESCNFLQKPECLRPTVLPELMRIPIIEKMQAWADSHHVDSTSTVINTRNPHFVHAQIKQDLLSYVNYLKNEPNESQRLPEMVSYLRKLESARQNCILDYLPHYEELLRNAGY